MKLFLRTMLLAYLLLAGAWPAGAQIEVNADEQRIVDVMETVASNIPYAGPFLSLASKLMFATKEEPGYEEMKREWQAYTHSEVQNARLESLLEGRDGYRALLAQIHRLEKGRPTSAGPDHDEHNRILYDKWDNIDSMLEKEIESFRSKPGQLARPTLAAYGELILFHLDANLTMVGLVDNGQPHSKNTEAYRTWVKEYNYHLEKYSRELVSEIWKAGQERENDVVLRGSQAYDGSVLLPTDRRYSIQNQMARYAQKKRDEFYRMYFALFELEDTHSVEGVRFKHHIKILSLNRHWPPPDPRHPFARGWKKLSNGHYVLD